MMQTIIKESRNKPIEKILILTCIDITGAGMDVRKVCHLSTESGTTAGVPRSCGSDSGIENAIYPQNLVLQLESPAHVDRIQV